MSSSHRRSYDDDDRSSSKTARSSAHADAASSYRAGSDRGGAAGAGGRAAYPSQQYNARGGSGAPERWTPGSSSAASAAPAAPTSGFIHPARLNPSAAAAASAPPPPPHRPAGPAHGGGYNNNYNNRPSYPSAPHAPHAAASAAAAARPAPARPAAAPQSSSSSAAARPSAPSSASVTQALLESERLAEAAYQSRLEEKIKAMEEEKTEEQLAAERQKKREAILAKFKVQAEQPLAATLSAEQKEKMLEQAGAVDSVNSAAAAAPAPAAEAAPAVEPATSSAAMTDVPAATPAAAAPVAAAPTAAVAAPFAVLAGDNDDDEYDMFSSDARLAPEAEAAALEGGGAGPNANRDLTVSGVGEMLDSWDDADGYYRYRLGDLLEGGRYRVTGLQGSGVFSTVLRVRELLFNPSQGGGAPSAEGRELVVKLIRHNERMYKAGLAELEFLKTLAANDPDNRKHVVKLHAHFMHRAHLCLVFEPMNMDLRKVIKKFGSVGVSLQAVRSYAKQLLLALKHLKKCAILHSDIKPDNMLVNEDLNVVKLCDFGSASRLTDECDITPLLVSRFYRAPEIMLGLKYNEEIDKWSVACCLFELYTGRILFQGADNNGMLRAIQEVKGKFPRKMLLKGKFSAEHFQLETGVFEYRKIDPVTGGERKVQMRIDKPVRDLYRLLKSASGGSGGKAELSEREQLKLKQLADLLEKMLMLDPSQRPKLEDLLQHPFITAEV